MNIIFELVNGDNTIVVHPDGSATIIATPPTPKELRAAREIVRLNAVIEGLVRAIQTGSPIIVQDITNRGDVIDVEARFV